MAKFPKKSILENILPHLISRFPLVAFFFKLILLYYLETYQFFLFFFFRFSILCCSQIGDDPIGRFSQSWLQAKYGILYKFLSYLWLLCIEETCWFFLIFFLNYEYWKPQKAHDFSTFFFFFFFWLFIYRASQNKGWNFRLVLKSYCQLMPNLTWDDSQIFT